MNKLLEFGRKAMFVVRVLSGYEERRIRAFRMELQQHLQQAQARKEAISKVPEKMILSEVRKMVEEMQVLNKQLDETEVAIQDYFKPLDKEAEIILKTQLQGEEKTMRHMVEAMQSKALLEKAEAAKKLANSQNAKADRAPECSDKTG